jgi:hypothetical protein
LILEKAEIGGLQLKVSLGKKPDLILKAKLSVVVHTIIPASLEMESGRLQSRIGLAKILRPYLQNH